MAAYHRPVHTAVAAILCASCTTLSVEGDIDGQTPEATEAIFFEEDGDDLDYFTVIISNIDDSCSILTDYYNEMNRLLEEVSEAETEAEVLLLAEDMNDEEENLPQERWEIEILLSTSNHSESTNSDRNFDGVEIDELIDDPGEMTIDIIHTTDHLDWVAVFEYALGERESVNLDANFYESNRGNASTGTYDSRSEMEITSDSSFREYDLFEGDYGNNAGSLQIEATASYCGEIERAME